MPQPAGGDGGFSNATVGGDSEGNGEGGSGAGGDGSGVSGEGGGGGEGSGGVGDGGTAPMAGSASCKPRGKVWADCNMGMASSSSECSEEERRRATRRGVALLLPLPAAPLALHPSAGAVGRPGAILCNMVSNSSLLSSKEKL